MHVFWLALRSRGRWSGHVFHVVEDDVVQPCSELSFLSSTHCQVIESF